MKPQEQVDNDRAHIYNGDEAEEEDCLQRATMKRLMKPVRH